MKYLAGVLCIVVALVAGAAPPKGHDRLPSADWKAMQQVIGEQLTALKAGDATKAMTYAVPGVRQQFRTPERFLRMVREGYRPLLDARSSSFLEGAVVDGQTIQPLQLVMPDNTVLVALFEMQKQKDGRWQIAGCVIAPSTAQST